MIGKINNFNRSNMVFRSKSQFPNEEKKEYHADYNDSYVRDMMRDDLDNQFGVAFKYADTIGKMPYEDWVVYLSTLTTLPLYQNIPPRYLSTKAPKKEYHVNDSKLKEIGYAYANERRKNELYSGPRLVTKPNGIELAKQAGIKTIFSLENYSDNFYCTPAKNAGLNFVALSEIGNETLHVFDIIPTQFDAPLIDKIIEQPETWATQNPDGTRKEDADKNMEDIQAFIDILDGKNENYPLPIYFGCQWGTNRTYTWYSFYNMLKNEDRTKPLTQEKINQLIAFRKDVEDAFYY